MIEEFELDLELQKKRVHEKIDPILESYNQNKITKKELVNRLSNIFFTSGSDIEERIVECDADQPSDCKECDILKECQDYKRRAFTST